MQVNKFILIVAIGIAGCGFALKGNAQIREIPEAVKNAFQKQYPQASQVQYDDKLIFVLVHFYPGQELPFSDSLHTAKYSSKGIWQLTDTPMPYDELPQAVKDGFEKSKYTRWQRDHTYKVFLPGRQLRYKIQVEKNILQKKNLYFEQDGRLISDNITLY